MKRVIRTGLSGLCLLGLCTSPAWAQDLMVSPALLQGAENGRAWSIAIDQESGALSGSVLDAEGVFAVFGACTVP